MNIINNGTGRIKILRLNRFEALVGESSTPLTTSALFNLYLFINRTKRWRLQRK